MSIALLPLFHFLFGVASLIWKKGGKRLFYLALVIDSAIIASLAQHLLHQTSISIVLGGWGRDIGIELVADRVTLAFSILAVLLGFAVVTYLWRDHLRGYFHLLLHLLFGSVFAMLVAHDLFNIYVVMELLTLVSSLLIGYRRKPQQIWASLNYLMLAALGMGVYLFGVAIIYYHTGTINMTLLADRLVGAQGQGWLIAAAILLVAGIAIKAGIFVFSLWLPAAHATAHSAVSALLSGLVIKMGIVALLRLSLVIDMQLPLLVLGAVTGLLGALYAAYTYDLKRMLAFHTMSQVGYMLIGIGVGSELAIIGSVAYAVGHGLFKGLLFLTSGEVVRTTGSKLIPEQISLREHIPRATRVALTIGTLAIMGAPPLAGFCAKCLIAEESAALLLQVLLGVISLGTVVSFAKLLPFFVYHRAPVGPRPITISFSILGMAIVGFLPLSFSFVPRSQWMAELNPYQAAEGMAIIAIGIITYRLIRKHPPALSQHIFRLEEAILVILAALIGLFALHVAF